MSVDGNTILIFAVSSEGVYRERDLAVLGSRQPERGRSCWREASGLMLGLAWCTILFFIISDVGSVHYGGDLGFIGGNNP